MGTPPRAPASRPPRPRPDAGFSLVEVIIAFMILAVGVLGLAGTTAIVVRQVTGSELATKRSAALMTTVERLRGMPYDSVKNGADTVGVFQVSWTTTDGTRSKLVKVVTVGPGMQSGGAGSFPMMSSQVADTFEYRILESW